MISVCMATYHGEKYREVQINSILSNISDKDEFIISDDGRDESFLNSLLREKEQGKPFIPLEGPGKGVVKNFEHAVRHAKGDIIFLADQDDVWTIDKVEKVMECFQNPECILVLHDADLIDENGRQIEESFYAIRGSRPGIMKNIWKNSYIGCCMAFRRELLEYALPFPKSKILLHDMWLGLVAEQHGKVEFIEDKLLHYRRHGSNVSDMEHFPIYKMIYKRLYACVALIIRRIRGKKPVVK